MVYNTRRNTILLFFAIIIFSCRTGVKGEEEKLNFTGVKINSDEKGNKISQFLIFENDTVHKILYKDNEIVYNEGTYAISEVSILNRSTSEISISIHSVEIDSLPKTVSIFKSVDGYNYDYVKILELDSTFNYFKYKFKDSIVDVILSVDYNVFSNPIDHHPQSPLIINFNTGTVDIKPEYLEKMKEIQVENVPNE